MTNIFALRLVDNQKPYILTVSDSQSTDITRGRRYNKVQKLFRRGNNLLSLSGDHIGLGLYLLDQLKQYPELNVLDTTERLLDLSKREKPSPERHLTFVVSGQVKDQPIIYHVDATGSRFGKPDFRPANYVFDGSGSQETERMFERDMEKAISAPGDLTEGVLFAYNLGMKAASDIGSNDKLQIGILSDNNLRLLYHPDVELGREFGDSWAYEVTQYLESNFSGLRLPDPNQNWEDYRKMADPLMMFMNDFYTALIISAARLDFQDSTVNSLNSLAKIDKDKREERLGEYQEQIRKRDEEKGQLSLLSTALFSGDYQRMRGALLEFRSKRENTYLEST